MCIMRVTSHAKMKSNLLKTEYTVFYIIGTTKCNLKLEFNGSRRHMSAAPSQDIICSSLVNRSEDIYIHYYTETHYNCQLIVRSRTSMFH